MIAPETTDAEILERAQRQQRRDLEGRHLRVVGDELVQAGEAVDPWENDPRRFSLGISNIDAGAKQRRAAEFMVVGALPGAGKTSLLEQSMVFNAKAGYKVLGVTLEMTIPEIDNKMIGRELGTDFDGFERHRKNNTTAYQDARHMLQSLPFKLYRPRDGEQAPIQKIFRLAENWGCDMIALDYAAKIGGWQPGNVAREIIAYVSARTKQTGIFMLMLAQLDQKVLLRKNIRPTMADFEDSKALAKEATSVGLIHRPFNGDPKRDTVAEFGMVKNRKSAPCFWGHTHWHGGTTSFYGMTPEEECRALCCAPKPKAPKKADAPQPRGDNEMTAAEEDRLMAEAQELFPH